MSITSDNLKIYFGLALAIVLGLIGIFFSGDILIFFAIISLAFTFMGYRLGCIAILVGFILYSFIPFVGIVTFFMWIGYTILIRSPLYTKSSSKNY